MGRAHVSACCIAHDRGLSPEDDAAPAVKPGPDIVGRCSSQGGTGDEPSASCVWRFGGTSSPMELAAGVKGGTVRPAASGGLCSGGECHTLCSPVLRSAPHVFHECGQAVANSHNWPATGTIELRRRCGRELAAPLRPELARAAAPC